MRRAFVARIRAFTPVFADYVAAGNGLRSNWYVLLEMVAHRVLERDG